MENETKRWSQQEEAENAGHPVHIHLHRVEKVHAMVNINKRAIETLLLMLLMAATW
jgi:hypothetical protein